MGAPGVVIRDDVGAAELRRFAQGEADRCVGLRALAIAQALEGANLRWRCAMLEKATCLVSTPTVRSTPGGPTRRSPAWPKRPRRTSAPQPGRACLLARAPRAHGSTTGRISNWPTWRQTSIAAPASACGCGLLTRRNIADNAQAFFTTWCNREAIPPRDVSEADSAGTGIDTLVAVEGHRWTIENSVATAKTEFGLDHNESRSWHGWHRHVSLVMLALAIMATIRHHASRAAASKTRPISTHTRPALSVGRSRTSAASPPASRNDASARLRSPHSRSRDEHTKPPHGVHIRNVIRNCSASPNQPRAPQYRSR